MKSNKKSKAKTKEKRFVFVVDSYPDGLHSILEGLGLQVWEDYYITGAGGANSVMDFTNIKKLLVFMSTFHGSIEPAFELSKEIKAANPEATIIFRSMTNTSSDPVFERSINKDSNVFVEIVKKFLGK